MTDLGDSTPLIDRGPWPLAEYAEFLAAVDGMLAADVRVGGLADRLVDQPWSSLFPVEEYARLEDATRSGRVERIHYRSGLLRIAGAVVRPPGPARRDFPVVLFLRGGNQNYGTLDERALLQMMAVADQGFLVLATTYRGADDSDGADEWGGADTEDVAALVSVASAFDVDVDPGRLFLYGVSRGGMMALVSVRRGLRVRAVAVRGAPLDLAEVADFQFQGGTATGRGLRGVFDQLMPGYLADPQGEMRRRSALAWPEEIRIPVLLVHAREDARVPWSQSDRFARALQQRGVPSSFVLFERDIHQAVWHRDDEVRLVTDWFRQHSGASW